MAWFLGDRFARHFLVGPAAQLGLCDEKGELLLKWHRTWLCKGSSSSHGCSSVVYRAGHRIQLVIAPTIRRIWPLEAVYHVNRLLVSMLLGIALFALSR